jgi:small nuclear ribonucleoprotein (snRNP)-like protein
VPYVLSCLQAHRSTLLLHMQSMTGKVVVVELKNDVELTGVLEEVDSNMK